MAAGVAISVQPELPSGERSSLKLVSLLELSDQVRLIWELLAGEAASPLGEVGGSGSVGAELVALQDIRLLEQPQRAIDRGHADARVDCRGPVMQLLDVGVIGGIGQDTRDHPALAGGGWFSHYRSACSDPERPGSHGTGKIGRSGVKH